MNLSLNSKNLLRPIGVTKKVALSSSSNLSNRNQIRSKIIKNLLDKDQPQERPKTIISIGPPASGKTFSRKMILSNYEKNSRIKIFDKDKMLHYMPICRIQLMLGHGYLVEFSKNEREELVNELELITKENKNSYYREHTGIDGLSGLVHKEKSLGRSVDGYVFTVEIEELYLRGIQRFKTTGRWTDLEYQLKSIINISNHLETYSRKFDQLKMYHSKPKMNIKLIENKEEFFSLYCSLAKDAKVLLDKIKALKLRNSIRERYSNTNDDRKKLNSENYQLLKQIGLPKDSFELKDNRNRFETPFIVDFSKVSIDKSIDYLKNFRHPSAIYNDKLLEESIIYYKDNYGN